MSILTDIVARKRVDVASRKAITCEAELRRGLTPSSRNFHEALRQPGRRFIMECKKASPTLGSINPQAHPATIAETYSAVADAISVLTDEPYFSGSFQDLRDVRATTDLPVLCKDFTVDPYQVVEARYHGADAVLLMLSVVDDATYQACAATAHEWGMTVLTEVHSEDEARRAIALGAPLVGINNRDLHTLSIDLQVTPSLAQLFPATTTLVSESGIRTHETTLDLADQVAGYLVGSHLMGSARTDLAARELVYGRVKVCGLTRPADARLAYDAGAVFGGLIFAPASPRAITAAQAREVQGAAPLNYVGVFADQSVDDVLEIAQALQLRAVQIHGGESETYLQDLRAHLDPDIEVWRAVPAGGCLGLPSGADRVLVDVPGADGGVTGGSGRAWDYTRAATHPLRPDMVLAGGINPSNVRAAAAVRPWAVDVNSGVESAPGHKDPTLVTALFQQLRLVGTREGSPIGSDDD